MSSQINKTDLEIIYTLSKLFKEDFNKVLHWLETPNPMFGELTPITLMRHHKSLKVLAFIKQQVSDKGL